MGLLALGGRSRSREEVRQDRHHSFCCRFSVQYVHRAHRRLSTVVSSCLQTTDTGYGNRGAYRGSGSGVPTHHRVTFGTPDRAFRYGSADVTREPNNSEASTFQQGFLYENNVFCMKWFSLSFRTALLGFVKLILRGDRDCGTLWCRRLMGCGGAITSNKKQKQ